MRLIALFCLTFLALPLRAEVTVFAAASLRGALDEVNESYDGNVIVSYASSAALARQIAQGAPADVFLSANPEWVDYLSNDPFVKLTAQETILSNRLVLVGSDGSQDATLAALPSVLEDRNLAMALTNAVPAGIYAKEALETLGLWEGLSEHVVQTDNVRAALALAALGEVDYAMVYQTDALADERVRVLAKVPTEAHRTIRYVGAVVGTNAEADAYYQFLLSDHAKQLFEQHGFLTSTGEGCWINPS